MGYFTFGFLGWNLQFTRGETAKKEEIETWGISLLGFFHWDFGVLGVVD